MGPDIGSWACKAIIALLFTNEKGKVRMFMIKRHDSQHSDRDRYVASVRRLLRLGQRTLAVEKNV